MGSLLALVAIVILVLGLLHAIALTVDLVAICVLILAAAVIVDGGWAGRLPRP